jgi:5'-nucleotidase
LVTNDDGVTSPGLHALALSLATAGYEVLVVAPSSDHSGFSAALGPLHLTGGVTFERVSLPGLTDVITLDGPPALCVVTACLGAFGDRPDLVISGINLGVNTGKAVLHSGTVGAALTASNLGVPSIAVSQVTGEPMHWATGARVATCLAPWVARCPEPFTLNVNVPNRPLGTVTAQVAPLEQGGQVQTVAFEVGEADLQLRLPASRPGPGTDSEIVAAGVVAITPLVPVQATDVALDGALELLADALRRPDDDQLVA